MADLPDYYTQAQISEAEAASFKGGLDANKSPTPVSRQVYFATDTGILYVCIADGVWTGFDAATLTQGILTLYANMLGGGFQIKNIADPTAAQDAATRAYVLAQLVAHAALTTGIHGVGASTIASIANIVAHAALDTGVHGAGANTLIHSGDTIAALTAPAADFSMNTHKITNLVDPALAQDAATKAYADLFTLLATFNNHKARHQAGGADVLNVAGLSGVLADPQTPIGHHTLHELGNADEIVNPLNAGALPALTTGKIWQGVANRPSEADVAGDMLKATYDPDEDGKIALAQLVDAVCSETEAGTITDGKITTHAALLTGIHGSSLIGKTSDQTVNNSETLVNVADMVLAVGATEKWIIHLIMIHISASTTPHIDYAFAVPTSGTISSLTNWATNGVGGFDDMTSEVDVAISASRKWTQVMCIYEGVGTAGNLQLQFAQHTATSEDTKMLAGTLMICHRIA